MVAADLVIRSARMVTPEGEIADDLAVSDGRIAAIGRDLPAGREEIDGRGLLLLPGGIDSHCHIAQRAIAGEIPSPDDFISATSAAAAGGVTTVLSHSMCGAAEDPDTVLGEYLASAEGRAVIDYGVHVQLGRADPGFLADGLPRLAERGFTSLKLFTTYEGYALDDAAVLAIMAAAARHGFLCLVHAEDDALIRFFKAREAAAGRNGLPAQAAGRPIAVEVEMIRRIGTYAKATGARVHIFHVSGADAVAALEAAGVSGETCPHYLTFTAADLDRPDFEGAKFLVSPALRTKADQAALWRALADGTLSVWSSDHSPQNRLAQIARAQETGAGPYTAFSGGMPGLQTLLPILFSEGVVAGRISLPRFVELTAGAPAALFGLVGRKGVLAVGADADLVLWNPEARWVVRQEDMLSNVDFTPWEGMELVGRPVLTISRGRIVARAGRIEPDAVGHGALLRRGRPA